MKRIISIAVIAMTVICMSCASYGGFKSCPTYSYIYKDVKTGAYGSGESIVYYYPAETVTLFPSKRQLVIMSVTEKVN